jgi:hypothetical protein
MNWQVILRQIHMCLIHSLGIISSLRRVGTASHALNGLGIELL